MKENAKSYLAVVLLAAAGIWLISIGTNSSKKETPQEITEEFSDENFDTQNITETEEVPLPEEEPTLKKSAKVTKLELDKKVINSKKGNAFDQSLLDRLNKFQVGVRSSVAEEQTQLKQAYELLSDIPEEITNYTERTGQKISREVLNQLIRVSLYAADNDASDYPSSLMALMLPTYEEELRSAYRNNSDPSAMEFF